MNEKYIKGKKKKTTLYCTGKWESHGIDIKSVCQNQHLSDKPAITN